MKNNSITQVNLKDFLRSQYIDSELNRVDVLVRYHSIKEYSKNNDYDFNLYKKMQRLRVKLDDTKSFKSLFDSFNERGFDETFPISCSVSHGLLNGSHRLALALFHNKDSIPIYVSDTRTDYPRYGLSWFSSRFSTEELKIIKEEIYSLNKFLDIKLKKG